MSELSVPLRPACLKEGHPCLPSPSSPPLSLFIPPFSLPFSSLTTSSPPLPSPGWFEGWCADLVIQIRATLSAQGPSSLVACPQSFFLLSPSSCGQRRPYKATFLLIHFCQFQHCHSNHCSGEWREAELAAVSLAARTVLFGLSRVDVSRASKLFFLIEVFWVLILFFCLC